MRRLGGTVSAKAGTSCMSPPWNCVRQGRDIQDVQITQVRAGVAGEDRVTYGVQSLIAGVAPQGGVEVYTLSPGSVQALRIRDAAGRGGGTVRALRVDG